MKLTETHDIIVEDRNVILRRYREPTPVYRKVNGASEPIGYSKGRMEVIGYYPTHTAALHAFVDLELRETPQAVPDLLRKIENLHSIIEELQWTD